MATDLNDPNIPTIYANAMFFTLGTSDVSIVFGNEFHGVNSGLITNWGVRIVLSHDQFLGMMQYWHKREGFLSEIYKGTPQNLNSAEKIDPEGFKNALIKWLDFIPDANDPQTDENEKRNSE